MSKSEVKKISSKLTNLDLYVLAKVRIECMGPKGLAKYLKEHKQLLPNKHQEKPIQTLFKMLHYHYSKLERMNLIKKSGYASWEYTGSPKDNLKFLQLSELPLESRKLNPHNIGFMFKIFERGDEFPSKTCMNNWNEEIYNDDTVEARKTTQNLKIKVKKPEVSAELKTPSEVEELIGMLTSLAIKEAERIEKKFRMVVDLSHHKRFMEECALEDSVTGLIQHGIRFDDTTTKKKYPNRFEFKSLIAIKNYFNSRTLENLLPELAETINKGSREALKDMIEYVDISQKERSTELNHLNETIDNKLTPAIGILSLQIEKHLEATKEWKDAAVSIKKTFDRFERKIERFISLSPAKAKTSNSQQKK